MASLTPILTSYPLAKPGGPGGPGSPGAPSLPPFPSFPPSPFWPWRQIIYTWNTALPVNPLAHEALSAPASLPPLSIPLLLDLLRAHEIPGFQDDNTNSDERQWCLLNRYRRSCYPLPAWPPHLPSVPLGQHCCQTHHCLWRGWDDGEGGHIMALWFCLQSCSPAPPWFHCSHTDQSPLLPGQFSWWASNSQNIVWKIPGWAWDQPPPQLLGALVILAPQAPLGRHGSIFLEAPEQKKG